MAMPNMKAYVVHALPRRVHVRASALAGQRGACARIAEALGRVPRCERVSVRPLTGSVVVECREGSLDPEDLARRVTELVAVEHDDDGKPLVGLRPERPGPTRVAVALVEAAHAINADINDALDHRADLGTLLPVAFAALGLGEIAATGQVPLPPWFQLFWWSLRSFMTFNAPMDGRAPAPAAEREVSGAVRS